MQVLAKGRNYILYTPCNRIYYFNKRNNNNCAAKVSQGKTVLMISKTFEGGRRDTPIDCMICMAK
jgi:hypothetical protein